MRDGKQTKSQQKWKREKKFEKKRKKNVEENQYTYADIVREEGTDI